MAKLSPLERDKCKENPTNKLTRKSGITTKERPLDPEPLIKVCNDNKRNQISIQNGRKTPRIAIP